MSRMVTVHSQHPPNADVESLLFGFVTDHFVSKVTVLNLLKQTFRQAEQTAFS